MTRTRASDLQLRSGASHLVLLSFHSQADPQNFEQLLMVEPLLTVRDFRTELSGEVVDTGELLRNYEFNISQGIVQRVSRFFDALALMDECGEEPPARGEGGKYADSARGGVMGFGHKRNVGNQEKSAHTVVLEQQVHPAVMAEKAEKERIQKEAKEAATAAARKAEWQDVEIIALAAAATEQDTKMAALEAKVAEMQALPAPSATLRPYLAHTRPPHTLRTLRAHRPSAHLSFCILPPYAHPLPRSTPFASTQSVPSPPASSAGTSCAGVV
jgi:hypothetical protein